MFLKNFLVSAVAFAVLDFIWLGFVMKKFNLRHLSEIGRIVDGDFQVHYGAAFIVYILMSLGVVIFVSPLAGSSVVKAIGLGAFMGLLVYGVFDMTNMAILKNYSWAFALADMAWGVFVFAAVSAITVWSAVKFNNI